MIHLVGASKNNDTCITLLRVIVVDEDGGNLFQGKTLVLFGFDLDYQQELTEIIQEVQGKCNF